MSHDSYTEEPNVDDEEEYDGLGRDGNNQDSLKVEDYSKIIEELQSHRKEIEKLQMDMSTSVTNTPSTTLNNSSKPRIINNEFFPFCPLEELQQQLDDIIDEEAEGKEDYITAEDFNTADQGFFVENIFTQFIDFASSSFYRIYFCALLLLLK